MSTANQQDPPPPPFNLDDVPKQTQKRFKSLAILVQSLTGLRVAVETKTGKCITGVLESCDANLNLLLTDVSAVYTVGRYEGDVSREAESYVSGASIRFVPLPDEVDDAAAHVLKYR